MDSPAATLPPNESEDGVVIAGPAVEIWPAEALHASALRSLSVFLRGQYKLNALDVKDARTGGVLGQTHWASYEASLRYLWNGPGFGIEAGAGYVRDDVSYDADPSNLMKLPSGDYSSIRFGARALTHVGVFEPFVAAETRIVMKGGELESRFTNASATGLHGALGVTATRGALYGRAELSYTRYSWSYPTDVNPTASGASDKLFGFSLGVGYLY
jgi:hypothetical protein